MEEKIVVVLNEMAEYLSIAQMKKLQEVIIKTFAENEANKLDISNEEFLQMFLDAKRIEGCSERTIEYYRATVKHLLSQTSTEVRKITTEEIRGYLSKYQKWNNCSNVTIDNVRRNISSFFSWLEEEDYILKSPMKRIHKIKTKTVVKSVISDEGIEKLRDNCVEKRDLAIIDLLYSTGIRVGELVNLNIDDIDLEGRECIVYGKGEHGNMTRLYSGQKKRYFFYAGRKDTVKACIYVKELVKFFKYRMIDNDFKGTDVFNCTFEPAYNIEQICTTMQKATGMKRHIPLIPGGLLMTAATILGPIGGKKVGIHPARVKKLMISTNICGKKLANCGYKFHYSFEDTFKDWFEDCDKEGLF